jgi:uroporphyrinogen decarboxylase
LGNDKINEITPGERFFTVLEHKIPDRVPIFDFLFSRPLYKEVLGREVNYYNDVDYFLLAEALDFDATLLTIGMPEDYIAKRLSEDTFIDEWGTVWKTVKNAWPAPGPLDYTIKSREDLKDFKIPDGTEDGRYYSAIEAVEKNNNKLATLAAVTGPFTQVMLIVGITRMSEYIYNDPDFIDDLLKIVTNFNIQLIEGFKKIGTDAIVLADDLGFADATFFNPDWYRDNLFSYFKEIVGAIKSNGMYPILHCDGNINPIIPDIINLGFDALNPLERKARMNLKEIRKKYNNKLALSGNVDSSTTLVFGSPEDIERETLQCMLDGGKDGSYILSSDHSFHDDIPNKNIFKMIETGKKYGKYPLQISI